MGDGKRDSERVESERRFGKRKSLTDLVEASVSMIK